MYFPFQLIHCHTNDLGFERTIRIFDKEFSLCGSGIRYVTFVKFQVYSVGIYVETSALAKLKSKFQKMQLPESNEQQICSAILDEPVDIAIRLYPIRNTDGGHLRNGIGRFLIADMPNDVNRKVNEESINELKLLLPKSKVAAGSHLTFYKEKSGILNIFVQDNFVGIVKNSWIGSRFIANYLCKAKPISAEAKQSFLSSFQ